MYICRECGKIFDETEFYTSSDFWGGPFEARQECCPRCSGEDFGEAKECAVCGEFYDEESLINDVCEHCIEKCRHDVDMCLEISLDEPKTEIKIDSFVAAMLDVSDIEAILIEHIKKRMPDADCSPFVDSDIDWFTEKLVAQEAHV
jgi:hypothetical protein